MPFMGSIKKMVSPSLSLFYLNHLIGLQHTKLVILRHNPVAIPIESFFVNQFAGNIVIS